MTADDFRKMALEIPGTVEQSHMNHPDFRLHGKIYASLGAPDVEWGMVKLTPEQQTAYVEKSPKAFKPCNGAWGRQGCTNVLLKSATATTLRSALVAASKNIAAKAAKPKTKTIKPTKRKKAR
jgi:hypothetical protein